MSRSSTRSPSCRYRRSPRRKLRNLAEQHAWLCRIAENKPWSPVRFWEKIDELDPFIGKVPAGLTAAIEEMLPEPGLDYRLASRFAGLGGRGRMRFVAIANWRGGWLAREAKALVPPASYWLRPHRRYRLPVAPAVLKRAPSCPDPMLRYIGDWVVRRLSPHCSRIELKHLGTGRRELGLLEAMGRETANFHLGSERQREAIVMDLRGRKRGWLRDAASAMMLATREDWKTWRDGRPTPPR